MLSVAVTAGCVGFGPATPYTAPDTGAVPPSGSIVDGVVARLRETAPEVEGSLWSETTTNTLEGDWLLQTPDCWGQATCSAPIGLNRILGRIEDNIADARSVVDILTLNPLPDTRFRDAVIRGLRRTLAAGNTPNNVVSEPCGSESMARTRWPRMLKPCAKTIALVVFVTPPLKLATATHIARWPGGRIFSAR